MIRAVLICLLLAGCVKPAYTLKGSGEAAPSPAGWDAHCEQIPKPDECKK